MRGKRGENGEERNMTDVRRYRAGSCKPRIREETSAGGERKMGLLR